ncbi:MULTISPECIES: 4'-phosphopantetheinyl transferase family protein [Bacillus]|uniref:4'-phosphopantetheinyl transferase family protein n=1 Tax=Bacillus TaxID=1386 RepID=UPI001CB8E4D5|nr:4'-phosphopantetheinyl transferase superfamily protein [Bacillus wiedmannii]
MLERYFEEEQKKLENRLPQSFKSELVLEQKKKKYKINVCVCYSLSADQYLEIVKYLHMNENSYFLKIKFKKRLESYLVGRYAAKKAVSAFIKDERLHEIQITPGIFNQPIVKHSSAMNVQVSISHCDSMGFAIAFSEETPIGIDIERINIDNKNILAAQMTVEEKRLAKFLSLPDETIYTLLWTAKESLSKVLKTGLTTPLEIYEINKIYISKGILYSYYQNFSQYCTASVISGQHIYSITYPKETVLDLEDFVVKLKMMNKNNENNKF